MKNQKGFSAVIVLLSVLVISVIGFAGYHVWNTQQDKKEAPVATATVAGAQEQSAETKAETPPAPTIDSSKEYLVIKELGIKVPISNWGYKPSTDSTSPQKYTIYSNQSKTIFDNMYCSPIADEDYSVGSIFVKDGKPEENEPGYTKELNGKYYVLHFRSQASCISNDGTLSPQSQELNAQQMKDMEAIKQAWNNASLN